MKASDLFVQALENEGVEYVFGLPGEENLDFLDSLSRSKIELILVRHEQGAGFMAATYGRLTGKVGVCLATLGPGATNLVTTAAYAQLGAMPMMMITGQKPIRSSRQGRFQIVNVVEMMKPLTKSARQIVDASAIPALVREGFRIATEERPGAVHLELPEDIAGEETDERVFESHPAFLPDADEDALNQAVALIRASRHPLLLIGAGANRKWICGPLCDFIEETGIPFFSTQMGKGVVDERHPLCLGTAALSSGDYLHLVLDRADLVINIGHDVVEKPPFFMERGGKKVVHVNFTPADTDAVYFPQAEVIGDIATSVRRLAKKLGHSDGHDFSFFTKVRDAVHAHIGEGGDDPRFPVIPQRLVADVRKAMPSDGIIALDNGIYKIWFARNYMAHEPNTVLLDNALATMGAGQASAMMAAMLYPERRVMAICGDGGFMMNCQEMETAVRLGLNLIIMVLRDDAYGMIRWKQNAHGLNPYSLQFGNPDFVAFAESFGAKGHRLAAADDLAPLLEACFGEKGVHLVEVPVDYSENEKVLTDELRQKTGLL